VFAGACRIDVTPTGSVFMEGMIRAGRSTGIHDRLFARSLVISNDRTVENAYAVISVDVCMVDAAFVSKTRRAIEDRCGMRPGNLIISTTHTHSGPSTYGSFQPLETEYLEELSGGILRAVEGSIKNLQPALLGCRSGREATISRYRRFMDENGKVVMIWEQNPAERNLRVLGEIDDELGVLKAVEAGDPSRVICVLFNHAGHPDVMSGDNLLISADYAGVAQRRVEQVFGGVGMFVNGAQGTVDIDNWKYRDWGGMESIGETLAGAVIATANAITPPSASSIAGESVAYHLPSRKVSAEEYGWAQDILKVTGGTFQAMPDGVGDDYKALLYDKLWKAQDTFIPFEQVCFAVDDTAFLSVGCELFTEIGMTIKRKSPFPHTYVLGLSNGYIGYVPTRDAISQGGYEVDTRAVGEEAADMIVERSITLLRSVHDRMEGVRRAGAGRERHTC
jgi:hypothetical protein